MLTPKSGPLGRRLAGHLLRRASYNLNKARIDEFASYTVQQAMDVLMTPIAPQYPEPRYIGFAPHPVDSNFQPGEEFVNCGTIPSSCDVNDLGSAGIDQTTLWWYYEAYQDTSMQHKMQYFLSTCLMPAIGSGYFKRYGYDGLSLLKQYAFGSYRVLARKITTSPGMMELLNVNGSMAGNANENFAREFMELYTIGKGAQVGPGDYTTYTEADVKEAAKLFTGFRYSHGGNILFNYDPETDLNSATAFHDAHDTADKVFSAAFGGQTITGAINSQDMFREVDEFVDMLFAQDHTALYICRRMYRFFVADEITTDTETQIIIPLAEVFRNSDYNMEIVMRALLCSQHFYEEDALGAGKVIGGLIADSNSLATLTLSRLGFVLPDITNALSDTGIFEMSSAYNIAAGLQPFFDPPSVAGFPANFQGPFWSDLWLDSGNIARRLNIQRGGILKAVNLADWVGNSTDTPDDAQAVVLAAIELFFPESPPQERIDYIYTQLFLRGMSASDWTNEWNMYQNSGNGDNIQLIVKTFLQDFLAALEIQVI